MDEIRKLLSQKKYNQPPEILKIKEFVKNKYKAVVSVKIQQNNFILTVDNASLASSIRLNIVELKEKCSLKSQKIIIKI
ncbi:MAG TPA: hypothetical protein VLF63_00970, partial [Patescibacteria group bacterium]|nr:hypothetical protein [Patescibacteria group bacterium]